MTGSSPAPDASPADHAPARSVARLRVVAIIPGDQFSGPAGQVASTAPELARLGVDVRCLLLRRPAAATGSLPAFLDRLGIPYRVLDDRGPFDVALARRTRGVLAEWRPDIVETHGYKATALALLLRRRRAGWRWVGFFHGLTSESARARLYHGLDIRMLARADRVVTISAEQQRHLRRAAPDARVVHSAVTITDDGTDTERSGLLAALAGLPHPRIAIVGRLSPEKGVGVFLRAAALLQARSRPFSAIIAGDGPDRAALVQLTASLGLSDRIRFVGRVSAMRSLYRAVDLLVIPSRSEGLPSVLLEALDADLPVVATRVGAIPEVLAVPEAGTLVAPDSPHELAAAIERALDAPGGEPARQARAAAVSAFSREHRARSLLAIYREVTPVCAGAMS